MNKYVRVLGQRKRIYAGWERKDRIKLGSVELSGYILVVKKGEFQKEFTVVDGKFIEGFNPDMLANHSPTYID